jgi:Leucine-rich repeat (LRR) protein
MYDLDHESQLSSTGFLDLSGNSFEGPIPKSFQFVDDLGKYTHASSASDIAIIPRLFTNTCLVVDVRLNNNAFSGEIPDVFSKIPNLSVFIAGSNEMEGSIPPSLAQAPNLVALQLHENELRGSIPNFESTKLNQLHLDSNDLTGKLPTLMAFTSASLEEMRLEGNRLTGSVPVAIGDHTSLKLLFLNGNQLKGTIPHELGRLEQMSKCFKKTSFALLSCC